MYMGDIRELCKPLDVLRYLLCKFCLGDGKVVVVPPPRPSTSLRASRNTTCTYTRDISELCQPTRPPLLALFSRSHSGCAVHTRQLLRSKAPGAGRGDLTPSALDEERAG